MCMKHGKYRKHGPEYLTTVQSHGVFGTTGQLVSTSGQVVETTCECLAVSTTDFYQLGGSVQLQLLNDSCSAKYYPYHEIQH